MDLSLEGLGMTSGWALAGTADGTSLEKSAWESIPRILPQHTRGEGSPDASIPHPELTPGPCHTGKPKGRPWWLLPTHT